MPFCGVPRGDARQQHLARARRDRQERRIGLAPLLAERRQHHVHHLLVVGQHMQQRVVIDAGLVHVGGAAEFVVEAEAVEEGAQPRIHVAAIALMRAEGVGDRRQRLAQIGRHHLLVGDVVRHLPQPVHIVGDGDQPGRDVAHQLEGAAHPGGAGDLAECADMGQTGRAIAGLEQDLLQGLAGRCPFLGPGHHLAGLLEGPGAGREGDLGRRAGGTGRHWKD